MLYQQLQQMEDHHTETEEKHQNMMKLIVDEHKSDRQQKDTDIQSLKGEVSRLLALSEEMTSRNNTLTKDLAALQNTTIEKSHMIEELDASLELVTSKCEEMKGRLTEINEVSNVDHKRLIISLTVVFCSLGLS